MVEKKVVQMVDEMVAKMGHQRVVQKVGKLADLTDERWVAWKVGC